MTLTKQEVAQLNKAYQRLYEILERMPTFLGDYFAKRSDYLNVVKWHCQLKGEEFDRKDWE